MGTEEQTILATTQVVKNDLNNIMMKDYVPENMSLLNFLNLIQAGVTEWHNLETYYRCAVMEVETKFRVLNEEFSMQYDRNPIETIKTRIKSPESLIQKLMKRKLPMSIESIEANIKDMAGIRVICSFLKDVDMLADCLLQQDDVTLLERKDYIRNPKPNGYRGLHLIVETPIFLQNEKRMMKVEVQLRTIAMDFWASLEHKLRYKKDIAPDVEACIEGELFDCAGRANELDRKMQDVRTMIENG